ncbi:MAG: DUF3489 domain-containing protein [Pseudomonadota bacterium]
MPQTKTPSKAAKVERLLSRQRGATLDDICKVTDWKPHSARAFLSSLRKRGFTIVREKHDETKSSYRITARPEASKQAAI